MGLQFRQEITQVFKQLRQLALTGDNRKGGLYTIFTFCFDRFISNFTHRHMECFV